MRNAFSNSVISYRNTEDSFFLTGDLGFMALEDVQSAFGSRFINCGVAEQNMVGVAAGIARQGNKVIVYSIAPFCYARPFEQIRNDISFNKLPVCLVGNGGGYGYGHMGPTHHALEDCAAMNALGVKVIVPAFDTDIREIIKSHIEQTCYLRLGYDCSPEGFVAPPFESWRLLLQGKAGVMVVLGPLAGEALQAFHNKKESERPALWVVCEFSCKQFPEEFLKSLEGNTLYIFEEHVLNGGLGTLISYGLVAMGYLPKKIIHKYALGYPTGRFGSQKFHRRQCELDAKGMEDHLVIGN